MNDDIREILAHIRPVYLALAFAGALAAESFWPSVRILKSIVNVAIGTLVSAVSTPAILALLAWKWSDLPDLTPFAGAAYFWVGLLAMQIVPLVSGYINKLKANKSE